MKYSFVILFAAVAVTMMASESSAAITSHLRNLVLQVLDGRKANFFLSRLKHYNLVDQNDDIAAAQQKMNDFNGDIMEDYFNLERALDQTEKYNPRDHGRERG
ncbi:uncharacterized protein LOC116349828 [Contarinia nasturtii]|uniref:uncharacterized protein LOC116349828 n=1 Tax=Contarinia nasturtii TaxID=265458 RepID=UPI0012D45D20|nr:uncharacterized protein LOC116349828 [Contarinia nasturtii]